MSDRNVDQEPVTSRLDYGHETLRLSWDSARATSPPSQARASSNLAPGEAMTGAILHSTSGSSPSIARALLAIRTASIAIGSGGSRRSCAADPHRYSAISA